MTIINKVCKRLFYKINYYMNTNENCKLFEYIKRQNFMEENNNYTYSYRYVKLINYLDNLDKQTMLQGITKKEKLIIDDHKLNMRLILNGEIPLNYDDGEWVEDDEEE